MRRVAILILCLSLWLCSSLLLYGCIDEKGEDEIKGSNTETNNPKGNDNDGVNTSPANVELCDLRQVTDRDGCIELFGELKNTGGRDATFCKVTFTFKNRYGSPIPFQDPWGNTYESVDAYVQGTNKTITAINSGYKESNAVLEPDGTGMFVLFTYIPFDPYVYPTLVAIDWREDETTFPDANLIVDGSISSSETENGFLELSGKVKNRGNTTAISGYITFILKGSG